LVFLLVNKYIIAIGEVGGIAPRIAINIAIDLSILL